MDSIFYCAIIFIYAIIGLIFFIVSGIFGFVLNKFEFPYKSISSFTESNNQKDLFTLSYRIFFPIILLIISSFLLNTFDNELYLKVFNSMWVALVFLFIFKFIFIFIVGRLLLFNKSYFLTTSIISISVGYFVNKQFFSPENLAKLLPDYTSIATGVWIFAGIFLYQIFTKINFSKNDKKREENYIKKQLILFNNQYGINLSLNKSDIYITVGENRKRKDDVMLNILYSIMIIENYNRPKILRNTLERTLPFLFKTRGIMQVKGAKNDIESINITKEKIVNKFDEIITKEKYDYEYSWYCDIAKVIRCHNRCDDYKEMGIEIFKIIDNIQD